MNESNATTEQQARPAGVLVDAHVHVHPGFNLGRFLTSAAENFTQAAIRQSGADACQRILCLTESYGINRFGEFCDIASGQASSETLEGSGWKIGLTSEPGSVVAEHPEMGRIFIVAGHQVVTKERLEVLALGSTTLWEDGSPLDETVTKVINTDAIACIPWGFGKWTGTRGKTVNKILSKFDTSSFYLGDNSGRPRFSFDPPIFKKARSAGIRILPGTDPLPFPSEESRAGRFGFHLSTPVDEQTPWGSLREQLVMKRAPVTQYGNLESPIRFCRNQIAMQWLTRGPHSKRAN